MNQTETLKRNWSLDKDDPVEAGDTNKRIRLGPEEEEKEQHNHNNNNDNSKNKDQITNDERNLNGNSSGPIVVEEGEELEGQNPSENSTNSRGHLIPTSGPNQRLTSSNNKRWRSHVMAEDYISLVGNMMYPPLQPMAPFGYDPCTGQYPLECITTLSLLTSPLRRPTVIEKWSPYEIAVFEASLALVGKKFHQVQKYVKTKNCKEIIEFYYIWKKTGHYKEWKKQFIDPEQEAAEDSDDEDDS